MAYKYWTEADITQLKRLVNKRVKVKEIARFLGKSVNAIEKIKTKHGIYKPMAKVWTHDEITQLKRLVNERKTVKEIVRIMGRSRSAVDKAKTRYGIYKPMTLSPHNPLHVAEVIKFKMAGWTLEQIGEVYGFTIAHVSQVLTRNGMVGLMPINNQREKPRHIWSEYELHRLRKYCKKDYSLDRICTYFPNRSRKAIECRIQRMTRFWFTPAQKEARRLSREHEMKWRVY